MAKVRLDIAVEPAETGVVTSDDFRYDYNPLSSTGVTMHAEPCPGYGFDRWELQTGEDQWDPLGLPGFPYATVNMTEDKIVRAVFLEHKVVNFQLDAVIEVPGICSAGGYQAGRLESTYSWESSTGNYAALDGKVVEILSYAPTVSESEIKACLGSHRTAILQSGGGMAVPCTAETVNIDPLWAAALGTSGSPFVPSRFYYWGLSDASDGELTDTNALQGPCWLSCASGQYTIMQYFFYVPDCGEIDLLLGPIGISRSSSGDHSNICIDKHSENLCSGCATEWQSCCN